MVTLGISMLPPTAPSTVAPAPVTVALAVGGAGSPSQWCAVLALSGRKVAGRGADSMLPIARVDEQRAQHQRFRHGGTGTVKPKEGHLDLPGGKGSGNNLVKQVAGKQKGSAGRH